jgi:hypothetical protein
MFCDKKLAWQFLLTSAKTREQQERGLRETSFAETMSQYGDCRYTIF